MRIIGTGHLISSSGLHMNTWEHKHHTSYTPPTHTHIYWPILIYLHEIKLSRDLEIKYAISEQPWFKLETG